MTFNTILFVVAMSLLLVIATTVTDRDLHGVKKYDCSISEFSPDYPVEVKEACRRMRAEKNKE